MQNYRQPVTKEVKFKYKDKSIRLKVLIGRGDKIKWDKVNSASSPNAVHMLDAQLVSSVILNADYNINVIHDSFGTVAADAGALFEDIRICFVNLFIEDILISIQEQTGVEIEIDLGQLDIHDTLDDLYAFN